MGDPSSLRFVPASKSATPIDWTRVPEATKKYLISQFGYDFEKREHKPLPATIGDLAKMFDKTKFFGYFGSTLIIALMDISEFGLHPTSTPGRSTTQLEAGPRFYMKYLQQVWFLLFVPGTRKCIRGYSADIIRNYDNDNSDDDDDDDEKYWKMENARAAEETAIAQAFDVTLEQEISRGMGTCVEFTEELGGWPATTLGSHLKYPY